MASTQSLVQQGRIPIALESFTVSGDGATKVEWLSLRTYGFTSPYEGSFVAHLRAAMRTELQNAGLYDAASALRIEAQLATNTLDIFSSSPGIAVAQARFVLRDGQTVRYDRMIRLTHEWGASFIGAIAIPAGTQNYAAMIRKLLGTLFADEDFRARLVQSRG